MAKKKKTQQELQEPAQQIFLAGLGALSRAEEEGSKLFQKLVKRGQAYDGPGAEQADAIRKELETRLAAIRERATDVQKEADKQAQAARSSVNQQVDRAKQGLGSVLEGIEGQLERAVTAALHGLGVPTRDEFAELQKSLRGIARDLDAARKERDVQRASVPDIEARSTGGGWYEIRVHGLVVDKVQGEDAAAARVEQLRAQDFSTGSDGAPGEITVAATGGGWYEVRVDGVAVDKVQGKRAAEAAVARLEQQTA
jgi:polyhydroxyalkanoate synthesis regulator phasin